MSEWVKIVIACIVLIICFIGVRKDGFAYGRETGINDGALMTLRAISEGHIRIEGRRLILDKNHVVFVNSKTGETISVIDMDDLKFEEVKL